MKTGARGLALIRAFEGYFETAYQDSVGVWTIGYGHTTAAGPPSVIPGMRISKAEVDALLVKDLAKVEREVSAAVTVPLTQNQFDALVSFHFNTGGLLRSTLLKVLNARLYQSVPDQLRRWDKAGGQTLRGLTRRREAEVALWKTADSQPAPLPPPPDIEPIPAPAPTPWLLSLLRGILSLFKRN